MIEVASPGHAGHDMVLKKNLYEKAGVTEYWVINPDTKESIGFLLKDGKYHKSGHYFGRIHLAITDNTEFAF